MALRLFDSLSEELWKRKVEQLVLQLLTDMARVHRRLDQRPRELFGIFPHGATAFDSTTPGVGQPGRIVEGILDGNLAPSTGDGSSASTATLSVYSGAGGSWADSGDNETITNRDDGFSAKAGEFLVAVELPSGELRPIHFPTVLRLAKTDSAHNKGASGTVSIYVGTAGSESDSGDNATAVNKFADLETTKWVVIGRIDGDEYLLAGEC